MAKRQRISVEKKGEPVNDPLAYESNLASKTVRKSCDKNENIRIEIWHDKHYSNRNQFGDDAGARIGIDEESVNSLVKRSIKHLISYSSKLDTFRFLNSSTVFVTKKERIVCQQEVDNSSLNVVIEAHYKVLNVIEVTIVTAMVVDSFNINDGQYVLVMIDNDNSILKRMNKTTLITIHNI